MENLNEIALKIYNAIFKKEKNVDLQGETFTIKKFSRGIKYVDAMGYRFIEQNRNKKSKWAKKAREGHQIIWVIKGRKYIAQIIDGEFNKLN
ncbi:MAG: hypothetical protein GF317_18745 [Candidatus Lokiarchaeota archaeon]|nr:hypothetical protein [Candidatus Lokiarchaeota archaeon]MBD3201556.1 hypothetical protein [Candidatus Lokiarchaeota archaeon]